MKKKDLQKLVKQSLKEVLKEQVDLQTITPDRDFKDDLGSSSSAFEAVTVYFLPGNDTCEEITLQVSSVGDDNSDGSTDGSITFPSITSGPFYDYLDSLGAVSMVSGVTFNQLTVPQDSPNNATTLVNILNGPTFGFTTFSVDCPFDDEPDPILGCTDEEATNYDPLATQDDGSCEYDDPDDGGDDGGDDDEPDPIYGCKLQNIQNQYPQYEEYVTNAVTAGNITHSLAKCKFRFCTDSDAYNYSPTHPSGQPWNYLNGVEADELCEYEGCTDPTAIPGGVSEETSPGSEMYFYNAANDGCGGTSPGGDGILPTGDLDEDNYDCCERPIDPYGGATCRKATVQQCMPGTSKPFTRTIDCLTIGNQTPTTDGSNSEFLDMGVTAGYGTTNPSSLPPQTSCPNDYNQLGQPFGGPGFDGEIRTTQGENGTWGCTYIWNANTAWMLVNPNDTGFIEEPKKETTSNYTRALAVFRVINIEVPTTETITNKEPYSCGMKPPSKRPLKPDTSPVGGGPSGMGISPRPPRRRISEEEILKKVIKVLKENNKKMKKSNLKEIAEELGYLNEQINVQTIQGGQCAGDIITDYTLNSGDYGSLVGAFTHLVNNYGISADFRNYAFPNTNGGYSNLEIDINMGGSSTMYFSIEAVHEAFGQGPFTSVGALFNYQNYTGGSISLGAISCTNVSGVDNSLPTTGLEPGVGTGTSGTGVAPGIKPTDILAKTKPIKTLAKTLQKRAGIERK